MNPVVQPDKTVAPASTTQSPQGVTSVAPTPAAVPTQLPTAPSPQQPAPLKPTTSNPTEGLSNIANFYGIPLKTAMASQAAQANGTQGGQQFEQQKFQAGIKEQNLRDQLDPSKYKVLQDPKSQYGIKIINSLGQPVDFGTYINLTGENPAQVLQQSTDKGAQQFVQAYNNYQDLMQTTIKASGGDEQAKLRLADYYAANPGLEHMKPQDVQSLFLDRYGQYMGMPQQQAANVSGVTPTFSNLNSPIAQSPYYQMQAYPSLSNPNPVANQLLGGGSNIADQLNSLAQSSGINLTAGG